MSPRYPAFWLLMLAVSQGKLVLQHYDEERGRVVDLHDLLQNLSDSLNTFRRDLNDIKEDVSAKLAQFERKVNERCDSQASPVLRNCADIYTHHSQTSGVYFVHPIESPSFQVYCDMTSDGGGWTVIQKRLNSYKITETNFSRKWQEYKDGFGSFSTDFWLGNEKLYLMTRYGEFELKVELQDTKYRNGFAKYSTFQVRSERESYSLHIGGYYGNVGDAMSRQNGMMFSTLDRDNDRNPGQHCAELLGGAWWYNGCHDTCLNGKRFRPIQTKWEDGIVWSTWKGERHIITQTEMKFRPTGWKP